MTKHFDDEFDYPDRFGKSNHKYTPRCYETHKPLPLKDGMVIYGGSCSHPAVPDADIYVGLDYSIEKSPKAFPWVSGESFLFSIPDMGVPSDVENFKKLVTWIIKQILMGQKVHVGCIGGHGRTGMVLSAVVAEMLGVKEAIQYVREHYCEKAVETARQVDFLVTHYKVAPIKGAKEHTGVLKFPSQRMMDRAPPKATKPAEPASAPKGKIKVTPAKNKMALWGDSVLFDKLS